MAPPADPTPRSIERTFRLFESLRTVPDGMTLAEVSSELETPKSSTLRLLRILTQAGYLQYNPPRYALGPAIFRFAAGLIAVREFPALIRPCMQRLLEQTHETVYVATLDADEKAAKYLDVLESPQPIRYSVQAGTSRPLYCSSAGRLLLAYQPRAWIESYLAATRLKPIMAKTIGSIRELRQEFKGRGVDLVDCSSGGIGTGSPTASPRALQLGFQVPYAARVREDAGLPTMAVGLIVSGRQAERILRQGKADLIAVGREMLFDPHWPVRAATELMGERAFDLLPPQYGWWLERRMRSGLNDAMRSLPDVE